MGCVYLLTSPSGKQYVGITKHTAEHRWARHKKDAACAKWTSALLAAIRKYGAGNFKLETLERHDDWAALCLAEQRLIAELGSKYPSGYNLTSGGDGAPELTPETEARRVAKSAASRTGLKLSDKHRAALSEAHKGLPSPRKGIKCSAEQRLRMSLAAKARIARTPREQVLKSISRARGE